MGPRGYKYHGPYGFQNRYKLKSVKIPRGPFPGLCPGNLPHYPPPLDGTGVSHPKEGDSEGRLGCHKLRIQTIYGLLTVLKETGKKVAKGKFRLEVDL